MRNQREMELVHFYATAHLGLAYNESSTLLFAIAMTCTCCCVLGEVEIILRIQHFARGHPVSLEVVKSCCNSLTCHSP